MDEETGSRNGEKMNEFMDYYQKIPDLKLYIRFFNGRWIINVTAPARTEFHGSMEAAHGMDMDREKAFLMALDGLKNYVKGAILS